MSEVKKSGFATAGLVVGIVGVCLSFIPAFSTVALVLGLLAIAFSIVTFVKKTLDNSSIAAVILGALAVIITFFMVATAYIRAVNVVSKVSSGVLDKTFGFIDRAFNSYDKTIDGIDKSVLDDTTGFFESIIGENTDEIMEKHLEVNFGEFEVKKDTYLTKTKLNLTVKNKSNKKRSFTIEIEAVDENGARLETDTVVVDRLGAGQSQSFEAFDNIADDKIEQIKNAEFRVYEASMY